MQKLVQRILHHPERIVVHPYTEPLKGPCKLHVRACLKISHFQATQPLHAEVSELQVGAGADARRWNGLPASYGVPRDQDEGRNNPVNGFQKKR